MADEHGGVAVTLTLYPHHHEFLDRLIAMNAVAMDNRPVASVLALQEHALDDEGRPIMETRPGDDLESARMVVELLDELKFQLDQARRRDAAAVSS